MVEAFSGITNFHPATVTIDTSDFTGLGTWTVRLDTTGDNDRIVLDYVSAAPPFTTFMDAAFLEKEAKRLHRLTEQSIATILNRIPKSDRTQVIRSLNLLRTAAEQTRTHLDCC